MWNIYNSCLPNEHCSLLSSSSPFIFTICYHNAYRQEEMCICLHLLLQWDLTPIAGGMLTPEMSKKAKKWTLSSLCKMPIHILTSITLTGNYYHFYVFRQIFTIWFWYMLELPFGQLIQESAYTYVDIYFLINFNGISLYIVDLCFFRENAAILDNSP